MERKAPEMAPSLTTANTDSFFIREPEGCEPSTNGPGLCGQAWGRLMPIFSFFLINYYFIIKSNYQILSNLPERPLRYCLRLGGHVKLSDVEETVGQGIKSTPSLFLLLVGTGNY